MMNYQPKTEEDMDFTDEEEEEAEIWMKHYSSKQRILLVGDGDYSFSLCLAKHFGSAQNMVASSLDTQEAIAEKYSKGIQNVRDLEQMGCLVLFGIDAKAMNDHFFLKTQRFHRIIYNFPHVGFHFREDSLCQIQMNKELMDGFFKNAKVLLKRDGGEVHVTHKEGEPYRKWALEKKAKKAGLALHEIVPFCVQDYPGYENKRAHGKFSDAPFPLGDCSTYKFKLEQSPP